MKKMIIAVLCDVFLIMGACFAENLSENANLYPINIGGKLNKEHYRIEGGKWGYIDQAGNMVIAPQFDYTDGFTEGLAAVKVREKWGYIDTTGKTVIPLQFYYAGSFAEGLAVVEIGEKWGYIDTTGKTVIASQFDDAWSFSEGLAGSSVR